MPRLLIDGTPIQTNPKGVGRYAYNVCAQLTQQLPEDWQIHILVNDPNVGAFPQTTRATMVPIRFRSEIRQALFELPKQVALLKPDLLLKTHESGGYVKGVPTVTVCHDIDELIWTAQGGTRNPLRHGINWYKQKLRKKLLQSSEYVVCNSEFIRKAVQGYYGIPVTKTVVGYCAVDPRFYEFSRAANREAVRERYKVARFILTFATGDPRENFSCYPVLAAKMLELDVDTCLLVAGVDLRSQYVADLRREFLERGLVEGRHFILEGFLGEDRFQDLVELYAAADFYLELSLHEGFGMQLVEAMACGTTCISSDRGALPEIGGGFVSFVNPVNMYEVAGTIRQAYAEGLDRRDNSNQIQYTRKFSWGETSNLISGVLMQIAARR